MKTNFNTKNLALVAALAAFLIVPGMAHAACQVSAASAFPSVVSAAGMVGTVTISAPATCPWTFTSRGSAFIRILSATSGKGSAVVTYQVLPNTTGRARSSAFGPEGASVQSVTYIGTRSTVVTEVSSGFTVTVTQNAH